MKNLHDILGGYGVTIPEEKKTEFDKAVNENYKTVADYDKQAAKLVLAEEKVATTAAALGKFDGVDVAAMQGEVATLRANLATKDTEHQQKLAQMEFDAQLDGAIAKAGGKSTRAVRGELADKLETLRGSQNRDSDLAAVLEALKAESGYLFGQDTPPPPYATHTGTQPINSGNPFGFSFAGVRSKPQNENKGD